MNTTIPTPTTIEHWVSDCFTGPARFKADIRMGTPSEWQPDVKATVHISREEGTEDNITAQSVFTLAPKGAQAKWVVDQGDLEIDEVPAKLWEKVWKAVLA